MTEKEQFTFPKKMTKTQIELKMGYLFPLQQTKL